MVTYTVGMKLNGKSEHIMVEAEDALIAVLRVKLLHPAAIITYARKTNERGDHRHPADEVMPARGRAVSSG